MTSRRRDRPAGIPALRRPTAPPGRGERSRPRSPARRPPRPRSPDHGPASVAGRLPDDPHAWIERPRKSAQGVSTFPWIIDPKPTAERSTEMLRGMSTVSLYADDVAAARDWYAELVGAEAYFARPVEGPPAYVEFRVGDYQHELGIIDRRYAPPGAGGPGGAILYWHVVDVQAV